jgi:hypothetical protein
MNRGLEHDLDKDSVAAARALGCTHLVTRDFASLPRLVRPPGSTDSVEIALVPDPLPLAAIARWPRLLPNEGSLAAPLLSAPGSAQALQLIDDPLGRLPPGSLLPSGAQAETATVTWRSADRATLRLSGRGEAVAVVNTAFQAGWKARQGGHELPVLRAAGVILAVLVEDTSAGPVELAYRPPRLWAGLGACLAGLLLLAGLAAIFGRVARVSSAGAPER